MIDTIVIHERLREVYSELAEIGEKSIAGRLGHFFSKSACWTTGGEYLEEVKIAIERVLAMGNGLPSHILDEMNAILNR